MLASKEHIHHLLENLGFFNKFTFLLIVSSGLAILLIGNPIEKSFPALSILIFIILFLFYLFIRIYDNSEKTLRDINESKLRQKMVYSSN